MDFNIPDDTFVCYATDRRGHRAEIRLVIPPEIMQTLSEVVESKAFPYRTRADVVRDGVVHRLVWLHNNSNQDYGDTLRRIAVINEIISFEETNLAFKETIKRLSATLKKINDFDRQKELVNNIAKQIAGLSDGYWRTQFIHEMEQEFSQYLDSSVFRSKAESGEDGNGLHGF